MRVQPDCEVGREGVGETGEVQGQRQEGGGKALVPASSIVDQGLQMQGAPQSGVKRKALLQLTEDVLTQGTQALDLQGNDRGTMEDLILNISIEDLVDNMGAEKPTWYPQFIDFVNKV